MILQVAEYRLADGERRRLGPAPRVVYDLDRNDAAYTAAGCMVSGPLHALTFELVRAASSDALLSAPLELASAVGRLIRCDRVDFPPGGLAYLHTHQGPGIRVVLHGAIRIETGGRIHSYGPLEAWFEPGPEPVFAAASETDPTAFVRCMVLPASLLGRRSIRYVREQDLAKPKAQEYTVFVDQPIAEQ